MATLKLKGRYYRIYPPEKFLGHAEKEFRIDTAEAAFLVVDVYGLGFDPGDESLSKWSGMVSKQSIEREKEIIVNHIRPAMDKARELGLPIVYVSNNYRADAIPDDLP